jgi:hypothetical protein
MYYTDNDYYLKFDADGVKESGYVWAGDVFWTYSNRNRILQGTARAGSPLF